MKSAIEELEKVLNSIKIESAEELEKFRLDFLSKKGKLADLVQQFRSVPPAEKKEFGKPLNELKSKFENFFSKNQESFNLSSNEDTDFDENLPLNSREYGSLHPIKMVESKRVFNLQAFDISFFLVLLIT